MALQPGTRLGSFEVLGPLGAGGMGEVYRARDTRLGRDVAIKVLPESFARDPARAARFEREARLLAAINHPAIGAIYGAEEFDSLRCIIMELVPGETLTERIARGPMPLEEACDLARQIAEALEAAHDKGVIHRDLKPSNIKVTPEGKIKVLDLGLAKVMELPSGEDLSQSPTQVDDQTRPGVILGTVEFMSPEQARGKPVDKRTDIWAFGCVFFEMLSGRRAFTGETPTDVFAAILSAEPDWSLLPAATPPRLRELLARCLQKDANRRLRDIGDARLEIERLQQGEGITVSASRSRSAGRPADEQEGRNTRVLAAALALALASGMGWLWLRPKTSPSATTPRDRSLVVLPAKISSDAAGGQLFGDGLVETLSNRLNKVPGIQVVTPAAAIAASDRDPDPFGAARSVGANLVVRSSVMRIGERVRFIYSVWNVQSRAQEAGDTIEGSPSELFGMQDELAERVATALRLPRPSRKTPTPSGLATADEQERYTRAIGSLQRSDRRASVEEAMRILRELSGESPSSPLVYAALGRADLSMYLLTQEKSWAEKAQEDCEKARQLDPDLPETHVTLGELRTRTGRALEGIGEFQNALRIRPNSMDALLGLANAFHFAGRAADAEATCRRAMALQPDYWVSYNQLGGYYYRQGNYPAAIKMFQRVVELTPDNVRGYNNLGGAYQQIDQFDKARTAYKSSILLKPSDGAYSNLGTLEFFLGRYREAGDAFENAIRLTPGKSLYWRNLADAYRWTPELRSKASEAYRRAVGLAEEALTVNPRDASAHVTLAVCLAKTGDFPNARAHMRRALELAPEDPNTLFQAAIVANLEGKQSEALQWIARARGKGLGAAQFERDPELQNLRKLPTFREAVKGGSA